MLICGLLVNLQILIIGRQGCMSGTVHAAACEVSKMQQLNDCVPTRVKTLKTLNPKHKECLMCLVRDQHAVTITIVVGNPFQLESVVLQKPQHACLMSAHTLSLL